MRARFIYQRPIAILLILAHFAAIGCSRTNPADPAPEGDAHPSTNAEALVIPDPFPYAIELDGAVDLQTAQAVIVGIGGEEFAQAQVGVAGNAAIPDEFIAIASSDRRAVLFHYSLSSREVLNRAEVDLAHGGAVSYRDNRGIGFVVANEEGAKKPGTIEPCEIAVGWGALMQCTLLGLAGAWFGVACGVKWIIIGALAC